MVRSAEATVKQLKDMTSDSSVHGIGMGKKNLPFRGTLSANEDRLSSSNIFKCSNCGIRQVVRECPVYGKTCHNCIAKKQHHFKSMCRSLKKGYGLTTEDEEEEYDCESPPFVGSVTSEVQIPNDECYVTLSVQGQPHAT